MNDTAIDVIRLQAIVRAGPQGHQALSESNSQQLYDSLPVIATDHSIRLLDLDALPRGSTIDTNKVPSTGTLRVISLKSSPSFALRGALLRGGATHRRSLTFSGYDLITVLVLRSI